MTLGRVWSLVAVLVTLHAQSLAQSCDHTIQAPIVLPVGNITVQNGKLRRGMQFQYGTPPQNIAVAVSTGFNETYVYNEDGYCSGVSAIQCTIGRGGAFDETSSSTWSSLSGINALNSGDQVTSQTGNNGTAGTDTLTVNSTLSLQSLDIAIPSTSGPDYSTFGLGVSSRVLDAAKNAGAIASRSWSLFWGQTGLTQATTHDGAIVLGGLDETQTTGNNYTAPIRHSANCRSGMIVAVTDMVVSLPDGSSSSLLSGSVQGQSVNYCLETEFPMITMLSEHFAEWESFDPSAETTGNAPDRAGGGPNVWGLIYPKSNITRADLKITIDNGLEVTIPNHQLVQAFYTFDSNGDMDVNDTMSELMINPLQSTNADDIPKFGMTFFQAAYLHVNHDTNQFTLWQAANPTGPGKFAGISSNSDTGCASSSNNTSPSTGNSGTSGDNSGSSSISGGAIGGIVAGAVVGTLALAALAFFFYRRRKSSLRKGPPSETAMPLNNMATGGYSDGRPEKPELMGSYMTDGKVSGYHSGKPELDSSSHLKQPQSLYSDAPWPSPQEVEAHAIHMPVREPQELPSERYD